MLVLQAGLGVTLMCVAAVITNIYELTVIIYYDTVTLFLLFFLTKISIVIDKIHYIYIAFFPNLGARQGSKPP